MGNPQAERRHHNPRDRFEIYQQCCAAPCFGKLKLSFLARPKRGGTCYEDTQSPLIFAKYSSRYVERYRHFDELLGPAASGVGSKCCRLTLLLDQTLKAILLVDADVVGGVYGACES